MVCYLTQQVDFTPVAACNAVNLICYVLPQAYQLVLPRCYDVSQLYLLAEAGCNEVLLAYFDTLRADLGALQLNRHALLRSNDVLQLNRNALQSVFCELARG